MNIDERLEQLVARHEALSQSVEIMLMNQKEQDGRIDRVLGMIDQLSRIVGNLAEVAANHERRIEGLEGGRA
jgi:hypothetical protein